MKNLILIFLLTITFEAVYAQSNELIGQYYLNMPAYNPSHAGSDNFLNINSGIRQQWTGFEGSPHNSFLSAYGAIRSNKNKQASPDLTTPKHGLGGYLMSNGQGPYKQSEVAITYAYHVPVAKNTYLSLGLSPTLYTEKIDVPKVTVEDQVNDETYQSLMSNGNSFTNLKLNAGLSLYSNKFYISYSLREAAKAAVSGNKDVFDNKAEVRHHFMAGYTFNLNEKLELIPNTFVRIDRLRPALVEVGARARLDKNKWAGASVRNDKTMVASLGFLLKDKFSFGYAFEYKRFGISKYARGTHELVIGIQLFKNKKA